jgi:hypothetical protein
MLYRKPSFLICTDPDASIREILHAYLWRWDIEVNFRDEKTLLGVGQAQVRDERSVEYVPALAVAAYAMLLTSATQAYGPPAAPTRGPPRSGGAREGCDHPPNRFFSISATRCEPKPSVSLASCHRTT